MASAALRRPHSRMVLSAPSHSRFSTGPVGMSPVLAALTTLLSAINSPEVGDGSSHSSASIQQPSRGTQCHPCCKTWAHTTSYGPLCHGSGDDQVAPKLTRECRLGVARRQETVTVC